jgi:hypothetical protein
MFKLIKITLVSIALFSCGTTQKSVSPTEYWNKTPDISNVIYEGGDGRTLDNCIVIKNANNELNGVAAEYSYISKIHGNKFIDWKPIGQSSQTNNGRTYDVISIITLPKNENIVYYFDITDFYGKF